jgi:hypothetical protein
MFEQHFYRRCRFNRRLITVLPVSLLPVITPAMHTKSYISVNFCKNSKVPISLHYLAQGEEQEVGHCSSLSRLAGLYGYSAELG